MLLCLSLGILHIVCVFVLNIMAYECIDGIVLLMMNTRFDIVTVEVYFIFK